MTRDKPDPVRPVARGGHVLGDGLAEVDDVGEPAPVEERPGLLVREPGALGDLEPDLADVGVGEEEVPLGHVPHVAVAVGGRVVLDLDRVAGEVAGVLAVVRGLDDRGEGARSASSSG